MGIAGHLEDTELDGKQMAAKKLILEKITFDIRPAVEDIAQLLSPSASKKGLILTCDFDPNLPKTIIRDPTRIRQINLKSEGPSLRFYLNDRISP